MVNKAMIVKVRLKYVLFVLAVVFAASCSKDDPLPDPEPPGPDPVPEDIVLAPKEMRGVWIASVWSLDWPQSVYDAAAQKKKYTDYLDLFVALHINAVFMQIRPNADAFYHSQYEPWSRWITGVAGKDPGYDVLAFMVEEAHKRGLEFHAWMNPYRIATRASESEQYPVLDSRINPAWVKSYSKIQVYNPALPEVQDRIANIVKDVINKYDVDGIHFDDYFYPDPDSYASLDDQDDYAAYGAGYNSIEAFRRGNVDKVVKKVYDVIAGEKPGVTFSVSPTANNAYNLNSLYADVTKWCTEGWVDVIIPQLYTATGTAESSFNVRLSWWNQYAYKAVPMIGYALYKFGDPTAGTQFQTTGELTEQFRLARNFPKIKGSVMYSAQYLNTNKLGIVDVIKNTIYPRPAVIPFTGRKTVDDPVPVAGVSLSGNKLKWDAGAGLRTVIYKVEDKKGLVVAITSEKECSLAEKGDYCLTTINKDHSESPVSNIITYK
jgi:uncharacterized lipoprotein YddW (UPF0748 family)